MLMLVKPYGKKSHDFVTLTLGQSFLGSSQCLALPLAQAKNGLEQKQAQKHFLGNQQRELACTQERQFCSLLGRAVDFLDFILFPFVFSSNSQRVHKVPKMFPNTFPITSHLSCILCPKFYLVTYSFHKKTIDSLINFLCPSQKDYLFIYLFIQVTRNTLSL